METSDAGDIEFVDMKKATVSIAMLGRVARSDAHFKHQQRGEPDLVFEEKLQIATQILEKNPATFLSRFGRYLSLEDLGYFADVKDQYEVDFHLKEIRRFLDDKKNETKKRNRRFEAMKQMMEKGEYFSAEVMKERDPLLYEQLIGQHQSEEDVKAEVEGRDLNFSTVLIEHVQALANSARYQEMYDKEHGQMEEGESDEEEEDMSETESKGEEKMNKVEKQMLKNEFLRTMQLRFLNGEDEFDYRIVDENEEFDSLDIREQDEEERYFDEEDDFPEDVNTDDVLPSDSDLTSVNERLETKPPGHRMAEAPDRLNGMDCGQEKGVDSEADLDYTDYVVTSDICPGLNNEDSLNKKQATNEKADDKVS